MNPETTIEEEVLKRVKPDKSERKKIERVCQEFLGLVDDHLTGPEKPRLVGSVSKGTYLKDPDIDVFVNFPLSTSKEGMEEKILKLGRKILDEPEERYAEHPYIHGFFQGFKVDVVPCYDIDDISQMRSAVDRTPFHTDHIIENLSKEQKDEAILIKAYLKGIDAYGAEAKVWGFSGYLCELLVLHYGSFREVLKNAKDWRPGKTIELVEGEKNFDDPLVVIDPVDPERNVASPVSMEKFALFVLSAKQFLKRPDIKFFFPKEISLKSDEKLYDVLERRSSNFLGLRFSRPDIVKDNLYPQVQKCINKLEHQLVHKDFDIIHTDYFVKSRRILLLFETEQRELTGIEQHKGPPVWVNNTEDFIEKHGEEVYIQDQRLWVDRERDKTEIKEVMKEIMKEVDLGSDINPLLPEEAEFIENEKLVEEEKKALNEFLDRTFPWER